MKTVKIIILLALFALKSCGDGVKWCGDDEFTMPRQINSTNKLQLNGYFYNQVNEDRADVCLLYQNGIFLDAYSFNMKKIIDNDVKFDYSALDYKFKGGWGIYKIDENNITIEKWVSRP